MHLPSYEIDANILMPHILEHNISWFMIYPNCEPKWIDFNGHVGAFTVGVPLLGVLRKTDFFR